MKDTKIKIDIAGNIAFYRKKLGLTQEQLAQRLFVSNKTVSKWERGVGYPEITQLVSLAANFGITVDRLINSERNGIALAGNILTDNVKLIESYPQKGMLSTISSLSRAVGGSVPNTGIDLACIDRTVPLSAIGKIGNDESGNYVLLELQKNGIDISGVKVSRNAPTSFSDVMSVESTGERTFFHHRGANAEFSPADVAISSLNCKMLHIGYILLLDKFDEADEEYGTVMARFLKSVQDAGIKTSIDVVSDSSGRFAEKVIPALKYTDNAIMNEIEGCGVANIPARDENGKLLTQNVRAAMETIMGYGVGERVIIHCPEAGFILNKNGEFTVVPSLALPKNFIKGSVGAGDAFCAGCLWGIYRSLSDKEILEFASGAAACNLTAEDSVSGMKSKETILEMIREMPRLTLD